MTEESNESDRVPPLNLTREEARLLWQMLVHEIGREEMHTEKRHNTAESIHTKVGNLVGAFEDE